MTSIINGVSVVESPGFLPKKSIIRAAEMVNGLGQTIGNYVRTQYVLEYKWTFLPSSVVTALLSALDPDSYLEFSVTHPTIEGNYTGTYRVTSPLQAENLTRDGDGNIVWGNVTLTLEEV